MARVSIHIHEEMGFAVVEVAEDVVGADIVAAAHTLHQHPQWDASYDVIWDGRAIASLAIEPSDMLDMVDAKAEDSVGEEITVVARELDEMIANLCALLLRARGREAKVFNTFDDALAELGLDSLPASME